MIESIISAIAGVVIEPVQGAKKDGFKGGVKGLGKGILGLIFKPVAGTLELVTQTTRGIGNTPKTVYVGITKMIKKRKGKIKRKIPLYEYPPIRPYIPTEREQRRREHKNPNEDSYQSENEDSYSNQSSEEDFNQE